MISLEQEITQLQQDVGNQTVAVDNLTQEVVGKMGAIDQRVNSAEQDFNSWKSSAFTSEEASLNVAIGSKKTIDLTHLASNIFYPVIVDKNKLTP